MIVFISFFIFLMMKAMKK